MATTVRNRNTILDKAMAVVYGRAEDVYGHPSVDMLCIARMWTAYLRKRGAFTEETEITPRDVAMMMVALKVSREAQKPHEDNLIDIAGYAEVANRVTTGR